MAPQKKSLQLNKQTTHPKTPQPAGPEHASLKLQSDSALHPQRAWADPRPAPLKPNDFLTLQRTLGNRAVNQLLSKPAGFPPRSTLPVQARPAVDPTGVASQIGRPPFQRPAPGAGGKVNRKPLVQPQPVEGGMEVGAGVDSAIRSARGGGQPLAEAVQIPMGNVLGSD